MPYTATQIFLVYKVSPQLFLFAPYALKNVHFSRFSGLSFVTNI